MKGYGKISRILIFLLVIFALFGCLQEDDGDDNGNDNGTNDTTNNNDDNGGETSGTLYTYDGNYSISDLTIDDNGQIYVVCTEENPIWNISSSGTQTTYMESSKTAEIGDTIIVKM